MTVLARLTVIIVLAAIYYGRDAVHPASAQSGQPRCLNIQLDITPGSTNGAAGHVGILYRIHNGRSSACTLTGYPGVRLLDRNFHDLPTHLHRGLLLDGRRTPSTVSLAGHGNAWFAILYRDVEAADGSCTSATYLLIFPPNDFLPVVTYAGQGGRAVRACVGELQISPVTSGHAGF